MVGNDVDDVIVRSARGKYGAEVKCRGCYDEDIGHYRIFTSPTDKIPARLSISRAATLFLLRIRLRL